MTEAVCAQDAQVDRLLAVLRHAAENGRVCPANTYLARVCGYSQPGGVSTGLDRLRRRGDITVRGSRRSRVIALPDGNETVSPTEHVEDIIAKAGAIFGVRASDIYSPTRYRHIIRARHAAMLVAFEAGHSTPTIGAVLARDHSTILYGRDQARNFEGRDAEYAERLNVLRRAAGL